MSVDAWCVSPEGKRDIERLSTLNAKRIVVSVVDEQHDCIFTDDDIAWLSEMDSAISTPLVEAIESHQATRNPLGNSVATPDCT